MTNIIKQLAELLKDYRKDEFLNPKEENISKWLSKFTPANQETILGEIINIANKLYLTKDEVDGFLNGLVNNKKITNNDPSTYWQNVSLLDIQQNGHSQSEMVDKFKNIIFNELVVIVAINDNANTSFIYIDNFLFTRNRLYQDISNCL